MNNYWSSWWLHISFWCFHGCPLHLFLRNRHVAFSLIRKHPNNLPKVWKHEAKTTDGRSRCQRNAWALLIFILLLTNPPVAPSRFHDGSNLEAKVQLLPPWLDITRSGFRWDGMIVLRFLQPGLALSNGFIQESAAAKMFPSHSHSLGHYLRWAWLLMDRSCTKSPHLHTFAIKRTKLRTCWPTVTFTSFNLAFNPITLTSRVEFSWPEIYVFLKEPRHENTSDLLEQCPIPFRTTLFTTSNNFRITRLKSVLCVQNASCKLFSSFSKTLLKWCSARSLNRNSMSICAR